MKTFNKAVIGGIIFATASTAYAGRCDGNNGNGQGNYCNSNPPVVNKETDRQYIERVHTYAHGNSLGIQALRRTTNTLEAGHNQQQTEIDALNQQATTISNTINNHGDVLSNHQQQIDDLGSRMSGEIAGALNRANEAHKEAKIAQDQAVAALSVAGMQFDLNYNGMQTAISAATFGGSTALSLGVGGKVSERVFVNAAVTTAGSATGGVVSSTFRW